MDWDCLEDEMTEGVQSPQKAAEGLLQNTATSGLPESCELPYAARDPPAEVTIHPSRLFRRWEGSAPSVKSSSLSLSANPSPLPGPRALVLLEDICRNPDVNIANMVKRQLAKGVAGSSNDKSPVKGDESGDPKDGPAAARKSSSQSEGMETGDRTVSSTTSTSKNIFEKFMTGRRSPRKRSNSPRCQKSGSAQDESSDAQSGNEEKQQMSIATAVKALRGLSEKVPETSGKSRTSRKDKATAKDSAKNSRNASPSSSTSPKCQNSTSPKRQSPRRLSDKMSPPCVASVQRSPRSRKSPSSCTGSDSGESPSTRRSVRSPRSPRRGGEPVTPGISSPDSSWNSLESESSPRDREKKTRAERSTAAGQRHSVQASSEEHTIHILSSTSRGSKVIQVERQRSPVCAVRKLFVNTQSGDPASGKRTTSPSKHQKCNSSHSDCGKEESEKQTHKTSASEAPLSSSSSSAPSLRCASSGTGLTKSGKSGPDESLLCAMLVGGSEVTQSYEKSREQKISHGNKAMSECSDSMDWKPSDSNSFLGLNDSFFDDDATGDVPEEKPYELPVLSRLPPLKKPDLSVLEVISTETCPSGSRCQALPPGHRNRTSHLLQLISKVTERLPADSKACQSVISDAQKVLSVENEDGSSTPQCSQAEDGEEKDQPRAQVTDRDKAGDQTVSSSSAKPGSSAGTPLPKDKQTEDVVQSSDVGTDVLSEGCGSSGDLTSEDRVQPMEVQVPDSPSSLGELDTTQITKAATQAVQNHVVKDCDAASRNSTLDVQGQGSSQATAKSQSGTPGASWLSSTGGLGMASESEDSRPGPSGRASSSQSQSRSFFSRIARGSPSRQRWKPKVESLANSGRPVWSKWHTIMSPQPISVLGRVEKSLTSRLSAFTSKDLDAYLSDSSNRFMVPACKESRLAQFLMEEGHVKDYDQLQRQISREEEMSKHGEKDGGKSEEDEDGEDDRDSEAAKKLDPDFDEVEGLVFVSFPSEMAVKAHLTLEKSRQWEGGPTAYLNMAKFHAFEESRRKEGKIRRESQGLRGQHMKWRRYQRLYRKELRTLYEENNKDAPWPLSKIPEKTSDIQKIKNWKNRFADMRSEDMEAMELLGEDEERIKRKRKTYVFSSKKKKVKRMQGCQDTFVGKKEQVEDAQDDSDSNKEQGEEDKGYGVPIPIDEDQYMKEVNSSIEELRLKEKGLKQCKGIFARFRMGPEDRHIFKKLGGWNTRFRRFRRMPKELKEGECPTRLPRKKTPRKDPNRQRFELKFLNVSLAMNAVMALRTEAGAEGWNRPARDAGLGSTVKTEGGDFVDLTLGESPSDLSSKKLHCDKPGCRYGCICHLCLPSVDIEDTDQTQTPVPSRGICDKEYCRLGCICDSLEKCGKTGSSQTALLLPDAGLAAQNASGGCSKPGCAEKCVCLPAVKDESKCEGKDPQPLTSVKHDLPPAHATQRGDAVDQTESSSDELPTLEKTAPRRQRSTDRYSNLPRRQTSYRIAKNLDAVSRKAMMMWEMSEVYSEQTTNRRKKMPDSMSSPAVTTSSPSVPSSPAIMSSAAFSTASSTSHSNMVTTAVAVNTLPAVVTSAAVLSGVPVVSLTPTTTTVKISPQVSQSSAARTLQDTSPVIVSDDEGNPDSHNTDAAPESKLQSKRPRKRRKPTSQDGDSEAPAPKASVTGASPVSAISLSSSPEVSTTPTASSCPPKQWHSTLICLRANNPTPVSVSDDVMEEDEIKLVEMIFNCPWDHAKEDILKAITSNVKRGVYPEPRVHVIGDFCVEILPKASRPSAIPVELRSKLPKYMYPVRVRVTEALKRKASESCRKDQKVAKSSHDASPLTAEAGKKNSSEVMKPVQAGVPRLMPVTSSPPICPVVPVHGVVPKLGAHAGNVALSSSLPTVMSTSFGSGVAGPGNMGISGLGRLQITQSKPVSTLMAAPGQPLQQHFKIQKKEVVPNQNEASQGKKKKKKKKKKNVLGDDSLVPDLSNLSVSPRKTQPGGPSLLTSTPLATSTPTLQCLAQVRGQLKEPGVSPVRPTQMSQSFPQPQPVNRLLRPMTATPRPQVLGFPNLPASLNNVKFLQLPGQNNLLQIVPASALGLKPMDNKNVPNFVAVPVSLTSIAQQNLASKKPGKVPVDVPPRMSTQTPQDPGRLAASGGNASSEKETVGGGGDKNSCLSSIPAPGDQEAVVKKKKKKKKKKTVDGSNPNGEGTKPRSSNPVFSSPLLVAGSPSPVMSCAGSYPVHSMTNIHGVHPCLPATTSTPTPLPLATAAPFAVQMSAKTPDTCASPLTMVTSTPLLLPTQPQLLTYIDTGVTVTEVGSLTTGVDAAPLKSSASRNRPRKDGGAHSGPRSGGAGDGADPSSVGSTSSPSSLTFTPGLPAGVGTDRDVASSPQTVSNLSFPVTSDLDSWQDESHAGISDEDSKGSWLEHVDLSSSEDDGLDVGTEPPAPDDLTSHLMAGRTVQENMIIRRDSERRRRDELKFGFRRLKNVLNVEGATLPRILSQRKILNKTVSLIQFHEKLTRVQEKSLKEFREVQAQLLKTLQAQIDLMLSQGVQQSTIQQLLSQIPLPDDLHAFRHPCPRANATRSNLQPLDFSAQRPATTVNSGGGQVRSANSSPGAGVAGKESSLADKIQAWPEAGLQGSPSEAACWRDEDSMEHSCDEAGCGNGTGKRIRVEEHRVPEQGCDRRDDVETVSRHLRGKQAGEEAGNHRGEGDADGGWWNSRVKCVGGSSEVAPLGVSSPDPSPSLTQRLHVSMADGGDEVDGDGGVTTGSTRGTWRSGEDRGAQGQGDTEGGVTGVRGKDCRADLSDDAAHRDCRGLGEEGTEENDLGLVITSVTSLQGLGSPSQQMEDMSGEENVGHCADDIS